MGSSTPIYLLIGLALVLANLPFVTRRFCLIWLPMGGKRIGWHFLELLLYFGLSLGAGMLLERQRGQISPQGWEFYAIMLALFFTLAFPGFVHRYLWKSRA